MKVRYLIKFTKDDSIKFIAHLDLMRTIQKIVRRAELPVEYSKGFNPHMALSMAQPLSVGHSSNGDYLDLVLAEELDEDTIKNKLNELSNVGIKFLEVKKVINNPNEKKVPQGMALIDAATYTVKIKYSGNDNIVKEVEELLESPKMEIIKKSKKGEKMVDIKPHILGASVSKEDEYVIINLEAACGSRNHLSPELFATYIKEHTKGSVENAFTYINRIEMFANKDNKLVPLYEYV